MEITNSVDIVIAVGVLNNAKNIEVTLKNIKKVLKKDGKVIIVEAIGESVQMLISQAFMMQEPDDARAEKNETFLKLYQWHELFQKVGFSKIKRIVQKYECTPEPLAMLDIKLLLLYLL